MSGGELGQLKRPPVLHSDSRPAGNCRMLGGSSPRAQWFADEAPAHARADDNEHLADLVASRWLKNCTPLPLSSSIVWRRCFVELVVTYASIPPLGSLATARAKSGAEMDMAASGVG